MKKARRWNRTTVNSFADCLICHSDIRAKAGQLGLEPRHTESKSVVLPIALLPNV